MKVTVIGTGYVGLIAGLGFAEFGNDVVCLDVVLEKIEMLQAGKCPIYEPGAEELLARNIRTKRVCFTTDAKHAIEHGELIFIAVGTPKGEGGDADLSYVYDSAREIGRHMDEYKVIVDKSTVPIGTSRRVAKVISGELQRRGVDIPFDVASNPEFLREGKAVGDFLNPDRVVIGVEGERAKRQLRKLYHVFERSKKPLIITTPETAEMIKYASNAFLATKITFINEIANLCDKVGANAIEVAHAMGADGRISPKFLHPGPGYGGSCFPKDTRALASTARKYGCPVTIVESVIAANENQKKLAAKKILSNMPDGGKIAILGLSFKPGTDDMREAPAIVVINELVKNGKYVINVYDPEAMDAAKEILPTDRLNWCKSAKEAIRGTGAVAVLTEWREFRNLDGECFCQMMAPGGKVFDFRHVFNRNEIQAAGLEYIGIGF